MYKRQGQPRPKVENPGLLLKRIMGEVFQHYLPHCIIVLICIVVSALANVQASLFLKSLIDDYIVPMTQQAAPDFGPLTAALLRVGCIYAVGVLAAWLNARIMVNVTQGTLRNLRTQLFTHMESLPIKYFDQHPHGDIMSVYTNDVDTLRQMLSQSIPQLVSSAITIVSVFASMVMLSWQLTVVTMCMVALMLFCSKKITSMSGKYFIAQQRDLGKVNGYIEEMMEGQKVVKVFTHEQKTLAGFRELNDKLKDSAKQANAYANIIMPVTAQLGNISYAVCALAGAAMAVGGIGGTTLGTVMAFLALNKSFNMPISQVSMQANSIIMALAGAERIFKLMDEPSETDEGYVTLVNAKYDKDDNLVETSDRTGIWAWKHPHHDGTTTYHKLEGDITFTGVDFGYVPEKTVLHDINLYGRPGQKIAFVGSTGAGKTTITNLINRFYDISDGKIRYDGINISKIKKDDLRRSLGIVLQETHLFTGTVMENVRMGAPVSPCARWVMRVISCPSGSSRVRVTSTETTCCPERLNRVSSQEGKPVLGASIRQTSTGLFKSIFKGKCLLCSVHFCYLIFLVAGAKPLQENAYSIRKSKNRTTKITDQYTRFWSVILFFRRDDACTWGLFPPAGQADAPFRFRSADS